MKNYLYESYDIIKINLSKSGQIGEAYALVLSECLTENPLQPNRYGIFIVEEKNYDPGLDFLVSNIDFQTTGQKMLASICPMQNIITQDDINDFIILPRSNASFKLTNEMRSAVKNVIRNYNLVGEINKYSRYLIYVENEITPGCSLLKAHDPRGYWLNKDNIAALAAPGLLPHRENYAVCENNLIQVKIYFDINLKIDRLDEDIIYSTYFVSLLINIKDSTIWDARSNHPAKNIFILSYSYLKLPV